MGCVTTLPRYDAPVGQTNRWRDSRGDHPAPGHLSPARVQCSPPRAAGRIGATGRSGAVLGGGRIPLAALGITYFLVREALEAWEGEG